jgi:hypothetical protein
MPAKPRLISVVCSVSLLMGVLSIGCSPDPCSPGEIEQHLDAITDVSRRFDGAVTLADGTPRMSLPTVIADLMAIRREADDLAVPPCAIDAKNLLAARMDATIDAFIAYLGQKPDEEVATAFEEAEQLLAEYHHEILMLTDPIGQANRDAAATAEAVSAATRAAEAIAYEATQMAEDAASRATRVAEAIAYVATEVAEDAPEQTATVAAGETASAIIALELQALDSHWGPGADCGGRNMSIAGCSYIVVGAEKDGRRLREGIGFTSGVKAALNDGHILRMLETGGAGWWRVGLPDGEQGWILVEQLRLKRVE